MHGAMQKRVFCPAIGSRWSRVSAHTHTDACEADGLISRKMYLFDLQPNKFAHAARGASWLLVGM